MHQDAEPLAPHFRERLLRPSFMTVTVALALLVTPSVGFLSTQLRDPIAERARWAEEADLALRADLLAQGLAPVRGKSPAVARLAELGIEVFAPERVFHLESGRAQLQGAPISDGNRERALATLAPELGRYPAQFFSRARLRRLLLCSSLHEDSEAIPSLPNYRGSLLLDVDADASYLRRLVHHEVFHFADYADDDQLSHDPAWLALNDRDFVYGSGGRFLREPGVGRFTDQIPGFVSRYATAALEEDKAETFAMRMSAPEKFAELIAEDAIVRAKSAALETQIRKLSARIDARFFASVDSR